MSAEITTDEAEQLFDAKFRDPEALAAALRPIVGSIFDELLGPDNFVLTTNVPAADGTVVRMPPPSFCHELTAHTSRSLHGPSFEFHRREYKDDFVGRLAALWEDRLASMGREIRRDFDNKEEKFVRRLAIVLTALPPKQTPSFPIVNWDGAGRARRYLTVIINWECYMEVDTDYVQGKRALVRHWLHSVVPGNLEQYFSGEIDHHRLFSADGYVRPNPKALFDEAKLFVTADAQKNFIRDCARDCAIPHESISGAEHVYQTSIVLCLEHSIDALQDNLNRLRDDMTAMFQAMLTNPPLRFVPETVDRSREKVVVCVLPTITMTPTYSSTAINVVGKVSFYRIVVPNVQRH